MIRLREECREFLDLRLGTELGILSDRVEEARRRAKAYPYDFIILSAHWCDGSPNFYSEPWGSYTNRDVFTLHLRRQLEYARIMEDFDVLGHITYYSRRSPYRDKEFRYTDAPDLLDALFQTLIETGRGIEINTSTCGSLGFSMPDYDILRRYRELGGRDRHRGLRCPYRPGPGAGLDHAAAILERAGFPTIPPSMAANRSFIPWRAVHDSGLSCAYRLFLRRQVHRGPIPSGGGCHGNGPRLFYRAFQSHGAGRRHRPDAAGHGRL